MATVYYIKEITPENLIKIYDAIGKQLPGKIACKVHTGEAGSDMFLRPEYLAPLVNKVGGTICECNAGYEGGRDSNEHHWQTIADHDWIKTFTKEKIDIMDEEGDEEVDIEDGFKIKKNYVGTHMKNYQSMLVLARFKGHDMGGYGASLKQLSIGCGSRKGKAYQHTGGVSLDPKDIFTKSAKNEDFMDSMADAATSVVRKFKGNMVFINTMVRIGLSCDCADVHIDPCMKDLGIVGSTDPVAADQACIDIVLASDDPGREALIQKMNGLKGYRTIKRAEEHGIGTRKYKLVTLE